MTLTYINYDGLTDAEQMAFLKWQLEIEADAENDPNIKATYALRTEATCKQASMTQPERIL